MHTLLLIGLILGFVVVLVVGVLSVLQDLLRATSYPPVSMPGRDEEEDRPADTEAVGSFDPTP
jgi:hypothetical protein